MKVRASGGSAALSMTLSVMDGTYRPFFELVSPPAPALQPIAQGKPGAGKSSQGASITRIVRMKPGAPIVGPMGAPAAIPVLVMVRDADGATSARNFVVRLLP